MAFEKFVDGIITKHRCDDDAVNVFSFIFFKMDNYLLTLNMLSTFLS